MISKDANDRIFEALFCQAVIDNYEEELSMIPSEEELSKLHSFSNRHIEGINRLFAQDKRNERLKATAKWARRCAAVLIVGTVLLFASLMTVSEVRATVTAVVIEWFEQFTKFTSEHGSSKELQAWEPSYLPEGFVEDERYGDFGRLTIRYLATGDKAMTFTYTSQSDSASIDNDQRNFSSIEISGITYYIFEAETPDKESTVIWDADGYRFVARGQLSAAELIKIAESVENNL